MCNLNLFKLPNLSLGRNETLPAWLGVSKAAPSIITGQVFNYLPAFACLACY